MAEHTALDPMAKTRAGMVLWWEGAVLLALAFIAQPALFAGLALLCAAAVILRAWRCRITVTVH